MKFPNPTRSSRIRSVERLEVELKADQESRVELASAAQSQVGLGNFMSQNWNFTDTI